MIAPDGTRPLALRKGDIVEVVGGLRDGFYEVNSSSTPGFVPASFVEEIKSGDNISSRNPLLLALTTRREAGKGPDRSATWKDSSRFNHPGASKRMRARFNFDPAAHPEFAPTNGVRK